MVFFSSSTLKPFHKIKIVFEKLFFYLLPFVNFYQRLNFRKIRNTLRKMHRYTANRHNKSTMKNQKGATQVFIIKASLVQNWYRSFHDIEKKIETSFMICISRIHCIMHTQYNHIVLG